MNAKQLKEFCRDVDLDLLISKLNKYPLKNKILYYFFQELQLSDNQKFKYLDDFAETCEFPLPLRNATIKWINHLIEDLNYSELQLLTACLISN